MLLNRDASQRDSDTTMRANPHQSTVILLRRMLLNGDASQWDRALQMPHYNARAMPAISFHTGVHLIQWARSGAFTLFDYGSPAKNRWASICLLHYQPVLSIVLVNSPDTPSIPPATSAANAAFRIHLCAASLRSL